MVAWKQLKPRLCLSNNSPSVSLAESVRPGPKPAGVFPCKFYNPLLLFCSKFHTYCWTRGKHHIYKHRDYCRLPRWSL